MGAGLAAVVLRWQSIRRAPATLRPHCAMGYAIDMTPRICRSPISPCCWPSISFPTTKHNTHTTHTHTHTLARAHIAECCSGVAARCCTTTRMAVPALQGWKMMLIDRTVLQFYNSNTYSVFSHPGGHFICRPPITWTCKWYTLCPPAAPSFTTIRYPSFDSPSFFATCPATTIRWPSMSRWRASA